MSSRKVLLSHRDAVTVRMLDRDLRNLGDDFKRWEVCSEYAVASQIGLVLLCWAWGLPVALFGVPAMVSIGAWVAAATFFNRRRGRLVVPPDWLMTALDVEAFDLQSNLPQDGNLYLLGEKPLRWYTARAWLRQWTANVEMPAVPIKVRRGQRLPFEGPTPPRRRMPSHRPDKPES